MTDPDDPIMAATHRALCEHGYADLTMQDIAAEYEKTKSNLLYHYDTKEALLVAFLDYLYDRYEAHVAGVDGEEPAAHLTALADTVLPPADERSADYEDLLTAIMEIEAQAPYNEALRDRLHRFDDLLLDEVRETVAEGVEAGVFRSDADPEHTAQLFVTLVNGARTRYVTGGDSLATARDLIGRHVCDDLRVPQEGPA